MDHAVRTSAIVIAMWAVGCGGAPPAAPRTNVGPPRAQRGALTVEANQNAPAPEPPDPSAVAPGLVLWCSQPGGPACAAARQELGQEATPAEEVGELLLSQPRDTQNDCIDPDLAPMMQRVTAAIGAGGNWVDQGGSIGTAHSVRSPYSGSGCLTAPQPATPTTKVHLADGAEGRRFMVRVWEAGEHG